MNDRKSRFHFDQGHAHDTLGPFMTLSSNPTRDEIPINPKVYREIQHLRKTYEDYHQSCEQRVSQRHNSQGL